MQSRCTRSSPYKSSPDKITFTGGARELAHQIIPEMRFHGSVGTCRGIGKRIIPGVPRPAILTDQPIRSHILMQGRRCSCGKLDTTHSNLSGVSVRQKGPQKHVVGQNRTTRTQQPRDRRGRGKDGDRETIHGVFSSEGVNSSRSGRRKPRKM